MNSNEKRNWMLTAVVAIIVLAVVFIFVRGVDVSNNQTGTIAPDLNDTEQMDPDGNLGAPDPDYPTPETGDLNPNESPTTQPNR